MHMQRTGVPATGVETSPAKKVKQELQTEGIEAWGFKRRLGRCCETLDLVK